MLSSRMISRIRSIHASSIARVVLKSATKAVQQNVQQTCSITITSQLAQNTKSSKGLISLNTDFPISKSGEIDRIQPAKTALISSDRNVLQCKPRLALHRAYSTVVSPHTYPKAETTITNLPVDEQKQQQDNNNDNQNNNNNNNNDEQEIPESARKEMNTGPLGFKSAVVFSVVLFFLIESKNFLDMFASLLSSPLINSVLAQQAYMGLVHELEEVLTKNPEKITENHAFQKQLVKSLSDPNPFIRECTIFLLDVLVENPTILKNLINYGLLPYLLTGGNGTTGRNASLLIELCDRLFLKIFEQSQCSDSLLQPQVINLLETLIKPTQPNYYKNLGLSALLRLLTIESAYPELQRQEQLKTYLEDIIQKYSITNPAAATTGESNEPQIHVTVRLYMYESAKMLLEALNNEQALPEVQQKLPNFIVKTPRLPTRNSMQAQMKMFTSLTDKNIELKSVGTLFTVSYAVICTIWSYFYCKKKWNKIPGVPASYALRMGQLAAVCSVLSSILIEIASAIDTKYMTEVPTYQTHINRITKAYVHQHGAEDPEAVRQLQAETESVPKVPKLAYAASLVCTGSTMAIGLYSWYKAKFIIMPTFYSFISAAVITLPVAYVKLRPMMDEAHNSGSRK